MRVPASRTCTLLTALLICSAVSLAAGPDDTKRDKSAADAAATTSASNAASSPARATAAGNTTAPTDTSTPAADAMQSSSSSSTPLSDGTAQSSSSNINSALPTPPKKGGMFSMGSSTADASHTWTPMPTVGGGLGLFTVDTGETLPKGGFAFSSGVNKYGRAPGSVTVLDTGFNGSVGLTDWLTIYAQFDPDEHVHVGLPGELSLNTPTTGAFQQYANSPFRSIFPIPGARPAYPEDVPFASLNGGGIGDVLVGAKIGLLSEDRGKPFTLAIDNEFFVPTYTGIGDLLSDEVQSGQLDYQLGVDVSKRFFSNNIQFAADAAYRFTPDASFNGFNVFSGAPETVRLGRADQVHLGAGFILFPNRRIQFMNEYTGVIFRGSATPDTTFGPRDPVDGVWGLRLYATRWLAVDVGYRYMLNLTQLNDRSGFVIKVDVTHWPEKPRVPDVVTASCSVDPSSIMAESGTAAQASARASDTYSLPLNYTWSSTGGKVDGTGPQVRWDSTGVAAGTYTLTASVDNGRGVSSSCSADITVQPKPNPPPTMSCSVDRSSVLVGERATITAAVNDQTGTPLTYTWQSNGGQIVGTGSSVQLDTTGLSAGDYTVTGRVENTKGGAADCNATVTVQAPPAAPQASKIGSCDFKSGSSKVDNVCKRTLDDVAVRLQNDPKAMVVFVGYSDPKERNADAVARDRGDNASKYLSQTKGVADSRTSSRTAAGTEGAGQDNYRVDIFFVPDGATY